MTSEVSFTALFAAAGVPDVPSPTTSETSVTFDGVTFTFDRPVTVGVFAYPGEPFAISDQAFNVVSITPASGDINGDGAIGNGAMLNPAIPDTGEGTKEQGWDQRLENYGDTNTADSKETPYNSALNIDPANSGNIAISPGQKASIVKSVRDAGASSTGAQFRQIDKYVTLTVLDAIPATGTCRPSMAGTDKTIRGLQHVQFTPRGLALPASWPDVPTIISNVATVVHAFHSDPENLRLMRTEPQGPTGYSGEIVDHHAKFVYAINTTAPTAQERENMIAQIITNANDIEGFQDTMLSLGAGAGQGGAFWLHAMAAAALTRDSTLLNKVRAWGLQPDKSALWVDSSLVGMSTPGKNGTAAATYFAEQVGLPDVNPEYFGSSYYERYVDIGGYIVAWEVLSILAFAQGPVGFNDGEEMLLNGSLLGPSNVYSSPLAWASVARTFSPQDWAPGGYQFGNEYNQPWDDLVAAGAVNPWTGRPMTPPRREYFSAVDGGIRFDEPSNFGYATEGSRTYDMRYSMDRVQFVEVTGVTDNQSVTGLIRGQEHLAQLRHVTASGASAWNYYGSTDTPIEDDSDWVGLVTPSGTGSNAAPTYVGGVAPSIHTRLHPAYPLEQWYPITGAFSQDEVEIAIGTGYLGDCYPAPTNITYELEVSDTGGGSGYSLHATGQKHYRSAALANKFVRGKITVTNSQGSVVEYTNEVLCPDIVNPPAGTLIDTPFDGAFRVNYETEYNEASANTENSTFSHLPSYSNSYSEAPSIPGALFLNKAKGQTNPRTNFILSKHDVEAGATYRIEAQVTTEREVALSGDVLIELRRNSDNTAYAAGVQQAIPARTVVDYDFTVAIPGGETDLTANIFIGMVGGASSGSTDDAYITYLKITKQ